MFQGTGISLGQDTYLWSMEQSSVSEPWKVVLLLCYVNHSQQAEKEDFCQMVIMEGTEPFLLHKA